MANNHVYGIRWFRSISGQSTPQVLTFPILSGETPNTVNSNGSADANTVNLNIGDPVYATAGTLHLTQAGADLTGANSTLAENVLGVIVGFPRGVIRGGVGPNSNFISGTTYSGGIGSDAAIVASIIPAAGNIFQIDADAVLSTPTRSGALALVGQTTSISYSILTSGAGQPKANPKLSVSNLQGTSSDANAGQIVIVGVGDIDQDQDYTVTGVTFQVMFTGQQLALNNNGSYGATT